MALEDPFAREAQVAARGASPRRGAARGRRRPPARAGDFRCAAVGSGGAPGGKLARQFRRDQADAARHYHQRDRSIEQRLDRGASLRADRDPVSRASRQTQNSRGPAGDHFVEAAPPADIFAPRRVRPADPPERSTRNRWPAPSGCRSAARRARRCGRASPGWTWGTRPARRRAAASDARPARREADAVDDRRALRRARPSSSRACTSRRAAASAPSAQWTRKG